MEKHSAQEHKGNKMRKILGDITRKADSKSNSCRVNETIAPRTKGVKRSSYEDGIKKQHLRPAKAQKVENMHPEIHHSEKSSKGRGGKTEREIIIIMDLSNNDEKCENREDRGSGGTRSPMKLPITQSLKDGDLYTVSGYEQNVNSKCILAMIEIIHENTDRANISCTNTDLFSYLVKLERDKAKSLVHPDDKARRLAGEPWYTYKRCKATAMSTVLLIPCHHEAINHWYLQARVKVQGGKHNGNGFCKEQYKKGQRIFNVNQSDGRGR